MDHQAEVQTKGAFIVNGNDVLGAADAGVVAAPVLDAHAEVLGEIFRQSKKFLGRSASFAELILPPSFFEAAPVQKLRRPIPIVVGNYLFPRSTKIFSRGWWRKTICWGLIE